MAVLGSSLPKSPKVLARTLHEHITREQERQSYIRTMWRLCYAYLNGARRFHLHSLNGQHIDTWHLDKEGNLLYQAPDMLSMIDRVAAKLASMDLSPSVVRNDRSLHSLRHRASAQIIGDAIVSTEQLNTAKRQFAHIFTALGSCGLYGDVGDHPIAGLTLDLEVVHPSEIFPFPALGFDMTKQSGICRQRVVPLSWLEDRLGKKISKSALENDCVAWKQLPGDLLEGNAEMQPVRGTNALAGAPSSGSAFSVTGPPNSRDGKDEYITAIQLNEAWFMGPRGTVSRYVATSGHHSFVDVNFYEQGQEVYCPLSWSVFMDTGDFYGAGLFNLMFSLVRRAEKLMNSLFNNVEDVDRYGVVIMPSGSWNQNLALRDIGRGLRALPYEPDVAAENFKPFVVTPFNSGDMPGKTAAFARSMIRDFNPLRDLAEEKGRVDSAAGLAFLDEQMNQAMTNPSSGIQTAFGQVYRAGVAGAASLLSTGPRSLPVSRLDLSLVGAVLDEENDRVSFTKNPLPRVGHLHFTVREVSPRSPSTRKAEAVEMLRLQAETAGQGDWDSFKLFAVRESLDFAMDMGVEKAAYTTIVGQILRLFNDGVTPGQIVESPHMARPDLQLRILDEFMAGPEIRLASVDVQNAFILYKQFLVEQMSVVLPEGVPTPEDAAALSALSSQQQAQESGAGPQLRIA